MLYNVLWPIYLLLLDNATNIFTDDHIPTKMRWSWTIVPRCNFYWIFRLLVLLDSFWTKAIFNRYRFNRRPVVGRWSAHFYRFYLILHLRGFHSLFIWPFVDWDRLPLEYGTPTSALLLVLFLYLTGDSLGYVSPWFCLVFVDVFSVHFSWKLHR